MIPAAHATRFARRPLAVLFVALTLHTVLTVGLPIPRQERASGSDLIAGEAFLSILMGGRAPEQRHRQPDDAVGGKSPAENARSEVSADGYDVVEQDVEMAKTSDSNFETSPRMQIGNEVEHRGAQETEEGTIIAVRVSSSVGHSMINKHVYTHAMRNEQVEDAVEDELPTTTVGTTAGTTDSNAVENELVQDQEAIASEDAPSLVAEANKSEFHVEEVEPISREYDVRNAHLGSPSSPVPFDGKTFPGTVIYHNNDGGSTRARSVSYSTVIQALPTAQKAWSPAGIAVRNGTVSEASSSLPDGNAGRPVSDASTAEAETKAYYERTANYYSPEPTERNWGIPEQNYHEPSKPYTPIVYAQPEQNYEVDEAASVETNGRAHGVQPVATPAAGKTPPGKKDDSQKVGYVVEGRNYRKYRVEERTSDGFIVGEYGVVRHDDGSLRGVRYTADGTISPRLIYDALMKFLSL